MFRIFARISALILVAIMIVSTVEATNSSRSITQQFSSIQGPSIHINVPQGKSSRRYRRHYKGKKYKHRSHYKGNKGKFIDGHDASHGRWDGRGPSPGHGKPHRR